MNSIQQISVTPFLFSFSCAASNTEWLFYGSFLDSLLLLLLSLSLLFFIIIVFYFVLFFLIAYNTQCVNTRKMWAGFTPNSLSLFVYGESQSKRYIYTQSPKVNKVNITAGEGDEYNMHICLDERDGKICCCWCCCCCWGGWEVHNKNQVANEYEVNPYLRSNGWKSPITKIYSKVVITSRAIFNESASIARRPYQSSFRNIRSGIWN